MRTSFLHSDAYSTSNSTINCYRAIFKSKEQEETILAEIRKLGHDPKSLPRIVSGKGGVKSQIREILENTSLFHSQRIFDKAWERLRDSRKIADKN